MIDSYDNPMKITFLNTKKMTDESETNLNFVTQF